MTTPQQRSQQRSISWAARREGNEGYVLETYSDGSTPREFGPMRANIVPTFIQSRRILYQMRAHNHGFTRISTQEGPEA